MGDYRIESLEKLKPLISLDTLKSSNTQQLNAFQELLCSIDDLQKVDNEFTVNHSIDTEQLLNMLLSREILIEILEALPAGVQIVNNSGVTQYVNPQFLDIVGVKLEERIGKNIFDLYPQGSLAKVLKTGKAVTNLKVKTKEFSIELVASASPIFYKEHMIGAVAIANDIEEVIILTEKLRESKHQLEKLSEKISNIASASYTFHNIIGESFIMQQVIEMAKIAAQNDTTVLILGETGTGKEVLANAIHNESKRSKQPFISINCSAIPMNLLESEFFGYEKGAFTGAYKRSIGKFELANGGTIFLDEIGDMDPVLQVKILRAIQEKQIQRIGGESKIPLDVRIIAATNRDLKKMVKKGSFREDLFYRLNVWNIQLPPLRERKEDLPDLIEFLINKVCRKLGKINTTFSPNAMEIMYQYDWPGNIRELENVIERVLISVKDHEQIMVEDLKFITIDETITSSNQFDSIMPLEKAEILILEKAIEKYGLTYEGKKKISKAAGISLATLYNKINKYKLGQGNR